ncbi:putative inorganic carbon transporter subunit DabA [Micromonospora sp. BRA006-A]|nr:putative inorganic carbon transporter subunit DabA [Micromonospora sp. BRA006-A]
MTAVRRRDASDRSDAARVVAALAAAGDHVAAVWPLDTFVAVNPLAGRERVPFARATAELRALGGARTHLPVDEYRRRLRDGEIEPADLTAVLPRRPRRRSRSADGRSRPRTSRSLHWSTRCTTGRPRHPTCSPWRGAARGDPARRRGRPGPAHLAELLDRALGTRIGADVDEPVAGWCAAHCGRPAARWPVPGPADELLGALAAGGRRRPRASAACGHSSPRCPRPSGQSPCCCAPSAWRRRPGRRISPGPCSGCRAGPATPAGPRRVPVSDRTSPRWTCSRSSSATSWRWPAPPPTATSASRRRSKR